MDFTWCFLASLRTSIGCLEASSATLARAAFATEGLIWSPGSTSTSSSSTWKSRCSTSSQTKLVSRRLQSLTSIFALLMVSILDDGCLLTTGLNSTVNWGAISFRLWGYKLFEATLLRACPHTRISETKNSSPPRRTRRPGFKRLPSPL